MRKQIDENFFSTWTPEMAYVLGFICADGSVYKNPNGYEYLGLYSTDKEILEKIRLAMGSDHKIGIRARARRHFPWEDLYGIQIRNSRWIEELHSYGIRQNKSRTLQLPKVPHVHLRHFVRGYFDGDGCAHYGVYWRKDRREWKKQFSVHFTSGSKMFLEDLKRVLGSVVRAGHISQKERGYELVFGQHDGVALFHFMYHNISAELFLERKFRKFQDAFQKLSIAGVV